MNKAWQGDCHIFPVAVGWQMLREDKEIPRNTNIYVGPREENLQSCCHR